MYRLDRTAFKINSFEEADRNAIYWRKQPLTERLRAANYLTHVAWGIPMGKMPALDRTYSKLRRRKMSNDVFNPDFQDFVRALNKNEVRYMLVGGYAVILHGYSRNTGDMDIWVEATSKNYQRLRQAFQDFGMPVFDMSEEKFLQTGDYNVFTFGVPPVAIDLITSLKGPSFSASYPQSSVHAFEDLEIRVISYQDLIAAKKAAGRHRDLNDIEQLEAGDDK